MAEQPLPPFTAKTCHVLDAKGGVVAMIVNVRGDEAESAEFARRVAESLNLAADLATWTDIECDFADGYGVRDAARETLQGRHLATPILYTAADEDRAAQAIRARYDPEYGFASRKSVPVKPRELVALVAEALGLRRAGG